MNQKIIVVILLLIYFIAAPHEYYRKYNPLKDIDNYKSEMAVEIGGHFPNMTEVNHILFDRIDVEPCLWNLNKKYEIINIYEKTSRIIIIRLIKKQLPRGRLKTEHLFLKRTRVCSKIKSTLIADDTMKEGEYYGL